MSIESDEESLPDLPNEQIDEDGDETESAELEQVAENTSRKLLILLGIGALILLLIHTTPLANNSRNWDALAHTFEGGGIKAELYFVLISSCS